MDENRLHVDMEDEMTRKIHTKEVAVDVEYVFYESRDGFPRAPRLTTKPLAKDPFVCQMHENMTMLMLYGTREPLGFSPIGGIRHPLPTLFERQYGLKPRFKRQATS